MDKKSYKDLEIYKESKRLATESLRDAELYKRLKADYEVLSKKINNYIKWVEENLNDFPL